MADKFTFSSAGEIQEVEFALARAEYTHQEVKELTKGDTLGLIRNVLLGHAEVRTLEYVIDLDADPFIPDGCTVEEGKHQKGGSFKWDPAKVQLYLSPNQQDGKSVKGDALSAELAGQPVFNANLLDYLLAHKHIIPEEWKKDEQGHTRYIFFWGTEYRRSGGRPFVRCLSWTDGRWHWSRLWLVCSWGVGAPAALRAS